MRDKKKNKNLLEQYYNITQYYTVNDLIEEPHLCVKVDFSNERT